MLRNKDVIFCKDNNKDDLCTNPSTTKRRLNYGASSEVRPERSCKRFSSLKPHIPNWLYHQDFVNFPRMKITEANAEDGFDATKIELGFMYDVLYTKPPNLYRWLRIIGLFFMVLSIASAFLVDMYIVYTYAILIARACLQLYQTMRIPFSDWTVVKMIRFRRNQFMVNITSCEANICIRQIMWSNNMGQLNLLEYCRQKEFPKLHRCGPSVLQERRGGQAALSVYSSSDPMDLTEVFHDCMNKLEKIRKQQPFNERGVWTYRRRFPLAIGMGLGFRLALPPPSISVFPPPSY